MAGPRSGRGRGCGGRQAVLPAIESHFLTWRLGVITALQVDGPQDFTSLKKRLAVPDGALGVHLQKLEEAGYIAADRGMIGRRRHTTYWISPRGRRALQQYLAQMQKIIDAVEASHKRRSGGQA
jgi:DNA-binding MarR family transcriptional regulator